MVFYLNVRAMHEVSINMTKHWGDLEEEEQEIEELEEKQLEVNIQFVNSLLRYYYFTILFSFLYGLVVSVGAILFIYKYCLFL